MEFTNSPLVTYTKLSPNHSGQRNHDIDTITIHCVVGQCSVEVLGSIFAPESRQASSNYGVGYDGRIGMYVEEKNRSWCSSSAANDHRAITIEVASDTTEPYAVNDKAFAALLDLVTDICKRNNIKKLVWSTKKADRVNHKNGCNLTVHRDYANKSCPGKYLYDRHNEIVAEVNKRLDAGEHEKSDVLYRVQVGAFKNKVYADAQLKKVSEAGFDTYMVQIDGFYKIQTGAFSKKANADAMLEKVQAAGFNAFITTKGGQAVSTAKPAPVVKKEIKVGSTVRLKKGAKTYTGGNLASFVYNRDHKVKEINVDRAVITFNNIVVAAVKKYDLTLVE